MAILPSFALVFRRRLWSAQGALALVALSASAVAAPAEPPLHPTLLSAEYQETAYPVVAAEKERPAVMIAGARKVLGATAPLQMARAARYHPVRARLDPEVIERTRYGLADLSGAQVQAQDIKVSVDITAEDEVADAYLLVIVDDGLPAAAGKAAPRPPTLRLQAVGALRKDEARRVDFTVTRVNPQRTGGRGATAVGDGGEGILYWQLFSEGIELRTNLSGDVAAFHRRREEGALRVAVAAWLRENARRDRGVQPFLQIPPLLASKDGLPPSVVATLTVGTDGLVSSVSLEPTPADEARQALENALGGWFFLPAVKAGQPVETRIRVPLKF
jgi:hypothetical protein